MIKRLFWQFFWFFWLAQIATSLLLGLTVWLLQSIAPHSIPFLIQPPNQERSLFPLIMPIIIGGCLSFLFAMLMAAYVTRPIRRLNLAFQAIAEGNLNERIGLSLETAQSELASLAAGFDHMATRLQIQVESQRRLLHDVSHEMRAPLARLQVAIGLIEKSPQHQTELTTRAVADIEQMNTFVNELLTLARLKSEKIIVPSELINIDELLLAISDDARFEATEKKCTIKIDCPANLSLMIHHELLYRALSNVVRNALRYAPKNSIITLRASIKDQAVKIDVGDLGKGVPEDELLSIFDPFVRSTTSEGEGYGLGLAITLSAVQAHGGTVHAENMAQGGFRIQISLPIPATKTVFY